jgi:hypothetical protein
MAVSCPGSRGTLLLISVYSIHVIKWNMCTVILVYDFSVLIACNCLVYKRMETVPIILPYFSLVDRMSM